MIWSDDEVLLVELERGIGEVNVENGVASSARIVAEGEGLRLLGSVEGEALFLRGSVVYKGAEALFDCGCVPQRIVSDGAYIAVICNNSVRLFDMTGRVKLEQTIGEDTLLASISARTGFLYLVKDRRSILACSFKLGGRTSTIYNISWRQVVEWK